MDVVAFIEQSLRYLTNEKDLLYVFCPCSIGDFLINGGLCHALLKKKRKKACVLIEHDRYISNAGLINFVGVIEVRYLPMEVAVFMQNYILATRQYETDNFIYGHFKIEQHAYISNPNLSFVDRYKENVFRLPLNTEVLPPIITPLTDYQKQRLHETYTLDKERTIILAPYANSNANLVESVWEKLVSELAKKNKDYVFYTNVAAPHEKVIPGTAPITTTFQELIYLAENVNCFIGHRSGIFDFLAFTNAKLLYINPRIGWWYYDLNLNYNHTNGKAFYFPFAPEQENLKAFMQHNGISSIDNINFYGYVSGRDVALNVNSLIEKIINEVD